MANDANSMAILKIQKFEERYQCQLDELLDESAPPKMVPFPVYFKVQQFVAWEDELFGNAQLSTTHKLTLRATRRAVEHGRTKDEQGRTHVYMGAIAEQIGVSPDTVSRSIKFLQSCGVVADRETKSEVNTRTGELKSRVYISLDKEKLDHPKEVEVSEEKLTHPKEIAPASPRKHGGDHYRCMICSEQGCTCKGTNVKIRTTRTLICKCCNHQVEIDSTERDLSPIPHGVLPDTSNTCSSGDTNEKQLAFTSNEAFPQSAEGANSIRTLEHGDQDTDSQVVSHAHASIWKCPQDDQGVHTHTEEGTNSTCIHDKDEQNTQKQLAFTSNEASTQSAEGTDNVRTPEQDAPATTQPGDDPNGSASRNMRPLLKPERGGMPDTVPQVAETGSSYWHQQDDQVTDAQSGSSSCGKVDDREDVATPDTRNREQGEPFCQPGQDGQATEKPDADSKGVSTGYTPDDTQANFGDTTKVTAPDLLLALAGPEPVHIEMAKSGKAKYYTVKRPLTREDILSHLKGGKARGALCYYPDGQTRGMAWDTDDTGEDAGWQALQDAMRVLSEHSYLPILEPSPAGRGGHAWIIFDGLVDTGQARAHVLSLAPALATFKEYWPGPKGSESRWNKVRLPGGRYTRPGVNAWCKLISVADGETATCGQASARLLLQYLTPARIVPNVTPHQNDEQKREDHVPDIRKMIPDQTIVTRGQAPTSTSQASVDQAWLARYGNTPEGKRLWFAFTPGYIASWYNKRHGVDEILPSETNGYGLASWRGERTASVKKDVKRERWTDFGASARRDDGSPDGGDALELQVRLSGAPKPEVMRAAARELLTVARTELEQAARSGILIPAWLEEIITEAGYLQYARLAEQAGHQDQARAARAKADLIEQAEAHQRTSQIEAEQRGQAQGVDTPENFGAQDVNFTPTPAAGQDQQPTPPMGGLSGFSSNPAIAVPNPQALAVEYDLIERYHLQHGAACPKCACELYRDMEGSQVCCRCYPQRGYHQYSDLIDQLYPRQSCKQAPPFLSY